MSQFDLRRIDRLPHVGHSTRRLYDAAQANVAALIAQSPCELEHMRLARFAVHVGRLGRPSNCVQAARTMTLPLSG